MNSLCKQAFLLQENRVSYLIKGGGLIDRFYGRTPQKDGTESQAWIASTVKSTLGTGEQGLSRLAPQFGGGLFADLVDRHAPVLLGAEHTALWGNHVGVLLKLLNSDDRLLVQTHPDKRKAKQYFGSGFGKTEAWYVLDCEEGKTAVIYAGFQPGITNQSFRRLIERQDTEAILGCLHRFAVKAGDVVLIKAGLPHALGAHCLVAEIQEPTDITLRAERFRPDGSELPEESLHSGIGMNGLLDCFCFETKDREQQRRAIFLCPQTTEPAVGVAARALVTHRDTPCFAMTELALQQSARFEKENAAFTIGLVLGGQGCFSCNGQTMPLRQGDEFFIPNQIRRYGYQAKEKLKILECYPPAKEETTR